MGAGRPNGTGAHRVEPARARDRLKVLHEVEEDHLTQVEGGRRLDLTDRQFRRLLVRVRATGDGGVVHRLRGRPSNRKIPEAVQQRVLRRLGQPCYAGFGPTCRWFCG